MNNIKLVCFDMDGTLINQNSWQQLNLALGVTSAEDTEMYEAYGDGKLTYQAWTNKLFNLYIERKLATKENVHQALTKYTFKVGAEDLVSYLQEKGYQIAIITGSFDVLAQQVAEHLHVQTYKANTRLLYDADNYIKEMISEGDELHAKLRHLENMCQALGIAIEECVCIGDGANDIELFNKTNKGITFFDAPEHIQAAAWQVVTDLSEIKNIL